MFPPATFVERKVTKEYKVPGTDLVLPVGLAVEIPVYGVHMDPKHYPDPEKFDPDRFSPEGSAERNPYAWMPFGQGPRACVGQRFALVKAKAAIAHIVHNFQLRPCKDTWEELKFDSNPLAYKAAKGLKIAMFPRL